jgi:hypothetical protein
MDAREQGSQKFMDIAQNLIEKIEIRNKLMKPTEKVKMQHK